MTSWIEKFDKKGENGSKILEKVQIGVNKQERIMYLFIVW